MNTLDMHTKEFQAWWLRQTRFQLTSEMIEAGAGWCACLIERHNIKSNAGKLRGIDPYCSGWNAAVDFILLYGERNEAP